jgi:hypothetical protein
VVAHMLLRVKKLFFSNIFVQVATLLVLGLLVARFSFSENWTGPYTPDSEFYLTLSIFGDEVNQRAVQPAYYWTKLGYIAPVHVLTSFLEVSAAFSVFRALLIMLTIAAAMRIAKVYQRSNFTGIIVSLTFGLNSVYLFWFGNTYFTGVALAITTLAIALTLGLIKDRTVVSKLGDSSLLGICLAWLLMMNPWVLIVTGGTAALMFLSTRPQAKLFGNTIRVSIFVTLGFFAGLGMFLIISELIFPHQSWLQTVLYWGRNLPAGAYASKDISLWITGKNTLLLTVAAFALLIFSGKGFFKDRNRSPIFMLILVSTSIYSYTAFIDYDPTLESAFYSALLIPFSLIAFFIIIFEHIPYDGEPSAFAVLVYAAVLIVLGHNRTILTPPISIALVAFLVLLLLVILRSRSVNRFPLLSYNRLTLAILVTGILFQFIQNSEANPKPGASLARIPYNTAFVNSDTSIGIKARIDSQSWLLDQTASISGEANKVMVTGDALYASMQLWGPNTASMTGSLTEFDSSNLLNIKPSYIASYETPNFSMDDEFFQDVGRLGAELSGIKCKSFVISSDSEKLELCVAKFDWGL